MSLYEVMLQKERVAAINESLKEKKREVFNYLKQM